MRKNNEINSLILDSGAYTMVNKGVNIDLTYYINYLSQHRGCFDCYFNLDPEFDDYHFSKVNLTNLLALENAGFNPIPVLHSVDNDEMDYYLDKGYKHIAVGDVQDSTEWKLDYVFSRLPSRPDIKVHVLGVSQYHFLVDYPIYSNDSSSWTKMGFDGTCLWINPRTQERDKIHVGGRLDGKIKKYHFNLHPDKELFFEYLDAEFGFTIGDLLGFDMYQNIKLVNMRFYVKLQDLITAEHIKNGFPAWDE